MACNDQTTQPRRPPIWEENLEFRQFSDTQKLDNQNFCKNHPIPGNWRVGKFSKFPFRKFSILNILFSRLTAPHTKTVAMTLYFKIQSPALDVQRSRQLPDILLSKQGIQDRAVQVCSVPSQSSQSKGQQIVVECEMYELLSRGLSSTLRSSS